MVTPDGSFPPGRTGPAIPPRAPANPGVSSLQGWLDAVARTAQGNDQAALESLLKHPPSTLPPQACLAVAELCLRLRWWDQAYQYLERIPNRSPEMGCKHLLAKNMACIARFRPSLLAVLNNVHITGKYRLYKLANGEVSVVHIPPDGQGKPMLLSPEGDPTNGVRFALEQLEPAIQKGWSIGIGGIADGYLLAKLAANPPVLFMDQQIAVHLFEPDAELVVQCLGLHDYTGPQGPIEQPRFIWQVGPDWAQQHWQNLTQDPYLSPPITVIYQGLSGQQIEETLHQQHQLRREQDQQSTQEIQSYYKQQTHRELANLFSENPPRPPRVLLLTSRFTTVLQYSTAQIAQGFKQLGWQTHTLIEPEPYKRVLGSSILRKLAQWKPDLVFTMDHLRREDRGLFPANLPHLCWVQDLLPNLTNPSAGQSLGLRDFVMTFATPLFVSCYDYPARQCIDVPMMMTAPPEVPPEAPPEAPQDIGHWTLDLGPQPPELPPKSSDDLVYLSNVSASPMELMELLPKRVTAKYLELAQECTRRLIAWYGQGDCLPTMYQVRQFLLATADELEYAPLAPADYQPIFDVLWNPINSSLYRQQALGWIADIADRLNIKLSLYGRGWEKHPRFGAYARGVLTPGVELDSVVRRAGINLNLEPYPCVTHNRLLNGLMTDGFFIIRDHPANQLIQELANFLDQHLDPSVEYSQQALETVKPTLKPALDRLLQDAVILSVCPKPDPVWEVRCYQRAGVVISQPMLLPHLDQVSFSNAQQAQTLMEQYLADPDARRRIVRDQRQNIENRLDIVTGLRRVVKQMARLISREPT